MVIQRAPGARFRGESLPQAVGTLVLVEDRASAEAAIPFARAMNGPKATLAIALVEPEPDPMAPSFPPDWLPELPGVAEGSVRATFIAESGYGACIDAAIAHFPPGFLLIIPSEKHLAAPAIGRLVASPPCRAAVINRPPTNLEAMKVLIATDDSNPDETARHSLYTFVNSFAAEATFLTVVPSRATPEQTLAAQERVSKVVKERGVEIPARALVTSARSLEGGILEELNANDYDLLIAEAPRSGLVLTLSERVLPPRLVSHRTPAFIYTQQAPFGVRTFMRAWNVIYRIVPSLSESERLSVYSQVRRNSRGDADFYIMLMLSVAIASFGLLQDSAAVVIGAMIVAPLMQPIVGIGMSVAVGSFALGRIALPTAVKGVLAAIILAIVIGWALPPEGITDQMASRGSPGILDLLVAIAAGAAGAYAIGRKNVASSVAGVAIAVALVPPLATAGLGIALTNGPLATGAFILFITNFAAIAASSALVFLWMGFKPHVDSVTRSVFFARGATALAACVGVVFIGLLAFQQAGESRFTLRVNEAVESAIEVYEPDATVAETTFKEVRGILEVTATVQTNDPDRLRFNSFGIQNAIAIDLERTVLLTLRVAETIQAPTPRIMPTPESQDD